MKRTANGTSLLFIEMMMALLFFLISGAVIVRVFAAADNKAKTAAAAEAAMLCAQSAAEHYSVNADPRAALCAVFGESAVTEGADGLTVRLDSECRPSPAGALTLTASESRTPSPAGTLSQLTLVFSTEKGELCELSCTAYAPNGGAADGQ